MKWLYLQRVADKDTEVYVEFENTIKNELLQKNCREDLVDDIRHILVLNPINHGGATINNSIDLTQINLQTSEVCISHISSVLMKCSEFNQLDHQKMIAAG